MSTKKSRKAEGSTKTSQTPPTRHSVDKLPFQSLDLPAELRNAIYEYTFYNSNILLRPLDSLDGRYYQFVQELSPVVPYHRGLAPLLTVNKQIREEGIEIFFERARFIVRGEWVRERLDTVMRKLGPKRRARVSRLCHRDSVPGKSTPSNARRSNVYRAAKLTLNAAVNAWDLEGMTKGTLKLEIELEGDGWRTGARE